MAGHIAGVVAVAQKQCLFPEVHAVPTARPNGVVLSAVVDVVVAVTGFLDIAGVEQVEHPVILQRRAGVNAVAVELFVAAKRRLVVLVMDEIRRFEVPPVVQPRLDIKGRVLEKDMVAAPKLAQPVGVVHPAGWRREVKLRTPFLCRRSGLLQSPAGANEILVRTFILRTSLLFRGRGKRSLRCFLVAEQPCQTKCHGHGNQHGNDILDGLVQVQQNRKDSRHTGRRCPQMKDRGHQRTAGTADGAKDKHLDGAQIDTEDRRFCNAPSCRTGLPEMPASGSSCSGSSGQRQGTLRPVPCWQQMPAAASMSFRKVPAEPHQ